MARVLNTPVAQQPDMEKGEMSKAISAELELVALPKIDTTDPEQVRERVDQYFKWCMNHDARPHVEQMALALKVTRQTLWNWRQTENERGRIIDNAVQVIASLTESWGINGKINPVTFIFLCKNHFSYRDAVEIEAKTSQPLADKSPAEIKRALEQDLPIDSDYKEL